MKGSIRKNKKWLNLIKIVVTNGNCIPYVKKYHEGRYYTRMLEDADYLESKGLLNKIRVGNVFGYALSYKGYKLMKKTKTMKI